MALIYPAKALPFAHQTYTQAGWQSDYEASITDNDAFWQSKIDLLDWVKKPTQIKNCSYELGNVNINWFADGVLNVSYNCIDRHLADSAAKTALIFEGDEPSESFCVSYQTLHDEVCRLANGLKSLGVKKGDRVAIYMPMTVEAVYAMQACARIGAVHSVIFGGFSPNAIADRIADCGAKCVITAQEGKRGGQTIPLLANVETALSQAHVTCVEHVLVKQAHKGAELNHPRSVCWDSLLSTQAATCPPEPMQAEDPLFILYTSGSTGKPKGLLHTTAGYLLYTMLTHKTVFDLKHDDIYWCGADVGWITGHSYITYGPLANGCTQVIFAGVPNYPTAGRLGEVVDKHQVSILYTAPTAIRALMAKGDEPTQSSKRSSLRVLGTVGEPINPAAWQWYYNEFGLGQCAIVDTWWQTETGGVMMTPIAGLTDMKPGSAMQAFLGIQPALVDANGQVLEGEGTGNLVICQSWPSQARTIWGDHERFEQTYFSAYPGYYFSGDGCRRDSDGHYWITGRVDDVLNVSGHRLGTAEIESALVAHDAIAEAAIVGYPHDIKGQGIYAYVIPTAGIEFDEALTRNVRDFVKQTLSPIAAPDHLQWTLGLPKTRSGKIMRRILRKIAANDFAELGDTSTLADPSVVDTLIANRLNT